MRELNVRQGAIAGTVISVVGAAAASGQQASGDLPAAPLVTFGYMLAVGLAATMLVTVGALAVNRRPVAEGLCGGLRIAGVGSRIVAYAIDAIALIFVGLVAFAVATRAGIAPYTLTTDGLATTVRVNYAGLLVVGIIDLGLSAGYFVYSWSRMHGTLGMQLLGIRIAQEADGRPLTVRQSLKRWLAFPAIYSIELLFNQWSGLGPVVSLAGVICFIALFASTANNPRKQGLHDRFAGSLVISSA